MHFVGLFLSSLLKMHGPKKIACLVVFLCGDYYNRLKTKFPAEVQNNLEMSYHLEMRYHLTYSVIQISWSRNNTCHWIAKLHIKDTACHSIFKILTKVYWVFLSVGCYIGTRISRVDCCLGLRVQELFSVVQRSWFIFSLEHWDDGSDPSLRIGQDSSVDIATRYGLDGQEIESRSRVRFSVPAQAGPGAHPAS